MMDDELCPMCGKPLGTHQARGNKIAADCAGPIECSCEEPQPDSIGECGRCRRRVMSVSVR